MPQTSPATGFGKFAVIWFGQFISSIGSSLTTFALGVWIYQQTNSVTLFALIAFSGTLPGILLSPIAGTIVDRWNRRLVLISSDLVAALGVTLLALLFYFHMLEIGYICAVVAIGSVCLSFRLPAYMASVSMLVPKQHLGRANGMVQSAEAAAQILAPVLAGLLLAFVQLPVIFLVDVLTFFCAVGTLVFIHIPQPEKTQEEASEERVGFFQDAFYGWTYISQRSGLLGLLIFFTLINFFFGMNEVLLTPMILHFTSVEVLGTLLSIGAIGLLVGGVLMSIWGGPQRRISGVLGFGFLFGLGLIATGLYPSIWLVGVAIFVALFTLPVVNSCSQSIWQAKVAQDVQGRVFAIRAMIAWSTAPIAQLIAGPLADHVFEPLFARGGMLSSSIGHIIGVGSGRGTAFFFIIAGVLASLAAILWYLMPRVRKIESDLPDMVPGESA